MFELVDSVWRAHVRSEARVGHMIQGVVMRRIGVEKSTLRFCTTKAHTC